MVEETHDSLYNLKHDQIASTTDTDLIGCTLLIHVLIEGIT